MVLLVNGLFFQSSILFDGRRENHLQFQLPPGTSPLKDPKRKLSDEERRSIVLEVDDILGISHENPEVNGIAKYAPSPVPTETDQAPRLLTTDY